MANYPLDYQGSRINALLEKIDQLGPATDQAAGTMSAADKGKLNGMEAGAQANVIEKVKINGTELTPASKAVNITVDSEPTSSSPNPVSSGGVKAGLATKVNISDIVDNLATNDATKPLSAKQGKVLGEQVSQLGQEVIYDVSANNGGVTFASLSALLSDENLSTLIPVAVRCGGMSIRFAQTSDNKYVQYMLIKNTWSILVRDWMKINVNDDILQVVNLTGLQAYSLNAWIGSNGNINYQNSEDYKTLVCRIDKEKTYLYFSGIIGGGTGGRYNFYDENLTFIETHEIDSRTWLTITPPLNAKYFMANIKFGNLWSQERTNQCCFIEKTSLINELLLKKSEFKGVAQKTTNPGEPVENAFYLAAPGTYNYFGQPTIENGNIGVFIYKNSTWNISSIPTGLSYKSIVDIGYKYSYSNPSANEIIYVGANMLIRKGQRYGVYIQSDVAADVGNYSNLCLMDGTTKISTEHSISSGTNLQYGYYAIITANEDAKNNGRVRLYDYLNAPQGNYTVRIINIDEPFSDILSLIKSNKSITEDIALLPLYSLIQSGSDVITSDLVVLPQKNIKVKVVAPGDVSVVIYAYNLTATAMNGNAQKSATCTNGSEFDFENYSCYKVKVLSNSLSDVVAMINSGELYIAYSGDNTSIVERNTAIEPMVKAIGSQMLPMPYYGNQHIQDLPIFVHVTDIHGDAKRLLNAYIFGKHIGAKYIINTGDTVISNYENGQKYAEDIDGMFDMITLPTAGNHDVTRSINDTNVYNSCIAYYANKYSLVANGKPYYYKDDAELKLRFICLYDYTNAYYDQGGKIDETQFNWLVSTLANTPQDYGIILFQHMCCVTSSNVTPIKADFNSPYINDWAVEAGPFIMQIIDAFISRTAKTVHVSLRYPEEDSFDIPVDFTSLTNQEFICHVNGHAHTDCIGYLPSEERQLSITSTLTNSLYGKYVDVNSEGTFAEIDNIPRSSAGTIQDSINVFAIDRTNKTVRIAKVGSNFTHALKVRDYVIAPYADE